MKELNEDKNRRCGMIASETVVNTLNAISLHYTLMSTINFTDNKQVLTEELVRVISL